MTRVPLAAAVAVVGAALAAAGSGLAAGWAAAALTFGILAPLGLLTTVAVRRVVDRHARGPTLRRQALVVGAIAAAQAAAAVALFVGLMFVSAHDALLTILVVAYTALVGGWAVARAGDAVIDRLDAEERARRRLFAAVSHDLRTPVTALRLLADAIADDVVDAPTARRYAARMGAHVDALGTLIDDLFELSRYEAGEVRLALREVVVADLVRGAVDAMRPQAEAAAVEVRAELGGDEVRATGDPDRLMRVLRNLLDNAIRHTPPRGTVTVRAVTDPDGTAIEVADTGSGIPPEEREHVFTAFHRLDPSRSPDGAGLGLAISRAIVEAHGGRIWIADGSAGTTVRMRLTR